MPIFFLQFHIVHIVRNLTLQFQVLESKRKTPLPQPAKCASAQSDDVTNVVLYQIISVCKHGICSSIARVSTRLALIYRVQYAKVDKHLRRPDVVSADFATAWRVGMLLAAIFEAHAWVIACATPRQLQPYITIHYTSQYDEIKT